MRKRRGGEKGLKGEEERRRKRTKRRGAEKGAKGMAWHERNTDKNILLTFY